MRVEWCTVEDLVELGGPGAFVDGNVEENDGYAVRLTHGTDGAVIEAPTQEALADFFEDLARQVRAAEMPAVEPEDV